MGLKADAERARQHPSTRAQIGLSRLCTRAGSLRAIGNKLSDWQGEIKHSAEQFLANLVNTNHGAQHAAADKFRDLTGLDITKEVQAAKAHRNSHPSFRIWEA